MPFSDEDEPAGQAVHTGCLSAAPQRFVIGSNSFRFPTCFEVPLRLALYPAMRAGPNKAEMDFGIHLTGGLRVGSIPSLNREDFVSPLLSRRQLERTELHAARMASPMSSDSPV